MLKFLNANRKLELSPRMFEGEIGLVITGLFGFMLAAGIGVYILIQGSIILPEGNMKDAFSFNAAIGMFILSIAAILPLARFGNRQKKVIRWLFISSSFYSYTIETIQNFRGLSPRFTREGDVIDMVAGMVFGIVSLVLVTLTVILASHFLRMKYPYERPLILLGIRYAFLSVIAANMAGIWMILLQDRFTGDAGNIIILHGIGFHALQTLVLPALFLESAQVKDSFKKRLIHLGSIAWMLMIILIGTQTGLGHSVFKLSTLPILASVLLFVWGGTFMIAFWHLIKQKTNTIYQQINPMEKSKKKYSLD
ncbi:hypothetical protein [Bacillus sp. Marseille-P3661]|uniref:hypothetical protein n=1 Tax=Bacillus sp. Marseille-P3661 TaxID=1936234 RepID=UPI0015E18E19|nr:hypothetical protein [Bacillus sp. Marseille-P3661]